MLNKPRAVAEGLTDRETELWDRLYYLTAIAGYAKQAINLVVSSTPMHMRALPAGCGTRVRIMDEVQLLIRMLEAGLTKGKYPTYAADLDTEVIELARDEREFTAQNS